MYLPIFLKCYTFYIFVITQIFLRPRIWRILSIIIPRYQRKISCKDELNKGQKWYGPNRSRIILRRGGKNTQKNYTKKVLHGPDNHDGVITHLQLDILDCKVKRALGSITTNKASGGDGIPVELFQILKDDAVNVLHSVYQQIWKT